MGAKVTAVLDGYHERMREEEKIRRESPGSPLQTCSIACCSPWGRRRAV
jgi:hypothetical protein